MLALEIPRSFSVPSFLDLGIEIEPIAVACCKTLLNFDYKFHLLLIDDLPQMFDKAARKLGLFDTYMLCFLMSLNSMRMSYINTFDEIRVKFQIR